VPQPRAHIPRINCDHGEAIAWFTGMLGFTLVEDGRLDEAKRRVLVAQPGAGHNAAALLLLAASTG
jgi:hypothetical protein